MKDQVTNNRNDKGKKERENEESIWKRKKRKKIKWEVKNLF